jgi:hypothetical protein
MFFLKIFSNIFVYVINEHKIQIRCSVAKNKLEKYVYSNLEFPFQFCYIVGRQLVVFLEPL